MDTRIPENVWACAEDTDFRRAQMTTQWFLQNLDEEERRMYRGMMNLRQLTMFDNTGPDNIEYIQCEHGILTIRLVIRGYLRTAAGFTEKPDRDVDMTKPDNPSTPVQPVLLFAPVDLSRNCLKQLDPSEHEAVMRFAYAYKKQLLDEKLQKLIDGSDEEGSVLDVQNQIFELTDEFAAIVADSLV